MTGSLLIQSDAQTGEPLLLHSMLPACIRERHKAKDTWVFLLDAQVSTFCITHHLHNNSRPFEQIGTGAAAFMAIRILLDHGVPQDHIIFVTFLVARNGGIGALRKAFPAVKIVCGAIDDGLRETWLAAIERGDGQIEAEARKVWVVEPGMGHIGTSFYSFSLRIFGCILKIHSGDRYYL